MIRRGARLEWFLGSALVLLAAQLGFAAWHEHSAGRTFLCLYSLTAPNRAPLLEVVDLPAHRQLPSAPKGYERRLLGALVEEAYPLRFVPAEIEPSLSCKLSAE